MAIKLFWNEAFGWEFYYLRTTNHHDAISLQSNLYQRCKDLKYHCENGGSKSPKRRYQIASQHGLTSQKTAVGLMLCVFLRRVRILNGDYQSRSQLSATSSLRNNLLSKLYVNPSEDEVVDYECGFRRNRPCTDHVFCIRHILDSFTLLGCYATLFSS